MPQNTLVVYSNDKKLNHNNENQVKSSILWNEVILAQTVNNTTIICKYCSIQTETLLRKLNKTQWYKAE